MTLHPKGFDMTLGRMRRLLEVLGTHKTGCRGHSRGRHKRQRFRQRFCRALLEAGALFCSRSHLPASGQLA